jgi:hypothetical protein
MPGKNRDNKLNKPVQMGEASSKKKKKKKRMSRWWWILIVSNCRWLSFSSFDFFFFFFLLLFASSYSTLLFTEKVSSFFLNDAFKSFSICFLYPISAIKCDFKSHSKLRNSFSLSLSRFVFLSPRVLLITERKKIVKHILPEANIAKYLLLLLCDCLYDLPSLNYSEMISHH